MYVVQSEKFYLPAGYIFVSKEIYTIYTVLGSCVAVCLWDRENYFGGMNHYIYAKAPAGRSKAIYGDISTRYLIELLLDAGSRPNSLRAHIVGGGVNPARKSQVGNENILIAEEILKKNKIRIMTRDVGGHTGRKVIFNNSNGNIFVYKIKHIRRNDWYTYDA
ncbi:MAG: chemotaxis protein CheD [Bacillota bacterium]